MYAQKNVLYWISQKFKREEYLCYQKIIRFLYKSRHCIKKIVLSNGVIVHAIPCPKNVMLKILYTRMKQHDKLVLHDSVYNALQKSDEAIIQESDKLNFHYDITHRPSVTWVSCYLKKESKDACSTFVVNDCGLKMRDFSSERMGWVDGFMDNDKAQLIQGVCLQLDNIPLEHIIILNYGMTLHSPPSEYFLNEHVFRRLFVDIQLNHNNKIVKRIMEHVNVEKRDHRLKALALVQSVVSPHIPAEHISYFANRYNWKFAKDVARFIKWDTFANVKDLVDSLDGVKVEDDGSPMSIILPQNPPMGITSHQLNVIETNIQQLFGSSVRLIQIRIYHNYCGTEARNLHIDSYFGYSGVNPLFTCSYSINASKKCSTECVKYFPTIDLSNVVSKETSHEITLQLDKKVSEFVDTGLLKLYSLDELVWTNISDYAYHRGPGGGKALKRFFFIVSM